MYIDTYSSPLGNILLAADDEGLNGLYFEGQKQFDDKLLTEREDKVSAILEDTRRWLDIYFSGEEPTFTPQLHMLGTDFRLTIWKLLLEIPYGKTTTYSKLAKLIAKQRSLQRFSAQAVGNAVANNHILIIVPCHRVIGSDGSLIGYAGGLDRKSKLLKLEGINYC